MLYWLNGLTFRDPLREVSRFFFNTVNCQMFSVCVCYIVLVHIYLIDQVCAGNEEPLLNGTNPVPDSHFTASSVNHPVNAAYMARLYSSDHGWVAEKREIDVVPPKFCLQVGS